MTYSTLDDFILRSATPKTSAISTALAAPTPSFPSPSSAVPPTLPSQSMQLPPPAMVTKSSSMTELETSNTSTRSFGRLTPIPDVEGRASEPEDLEGQNAVTGAQWGISLTTWKYLQLVGGFLMNCLSWGIVTSFGTFFDLAFLGNPSPTLF